MTEPGADRNRTAYDSPKVAAHYAALNYLTPCERMLFDSYIPAGSSILDLGVGGGRTTSYLANRAGRYVGVDCATEMIRTCQSKFPGLQFVAANAADLSSFPDRSFDVVVFSFNGVDYVVPEQSRHSCFEHIHRILKLRGTLIFSSHNARAVLIWPRWNPERLQRTARRFSAGSKLLYGPLLALLTSARVTLACASSVGATLRRAVKRIPSRVFWRGDGILLDSIHGGVLTHYCIPSRVTAELQALGLRPERILGDDYPQPSHPFTTDWYYYVFTKPCEQ